MVPCATPVAETSFRLFRFYRALKEDTLPRFGQSYSEPLGPAPPSTIKLLDFQVRNGEEFKLAFGY